MATTSCYSDNLKILRHNKDATVEDVVVSAQAVVDCVNPGKGCFGNSAWNVYQYMQTGAGLPDSSCDPFLSKMFEDCKSHMCLACNVSAKTVSDCAPARSFSKYRVQSHGNITIPNASTSAASPREFLRATPNTTMEEKMRTAISTYGPIECMITDGPASFVNYNGTGIICEATNVTGRSHDVELVGWGEDQGMKYWIGRNSWGSAWGDFGWFRLCRGINNLGIEQDQGCAWVVPVL